MYRFPIGVITESFCVDTRSAIIKAAELGADGIQMYAADCENSPEKLNAEKRRELLDYVRSHGLEFSALCGDFGKGFTNRELNPILIEKSKRILDMAKDLGTDIVTTHIGAVPRDPAHERYKIMQEACFELASYADSIGSHFAIETGPETSIVLKGFLDSLGSTGVGVNLDPANLVMVTGDDPVEAVYNLRKYIVHTHAKDGLMLKRMNPAYIYGGETMPAHLHGVPAFREVPLGEGAVDFTGYLKALEDIGYKGYLTIEREVGENPGADILTAKNHLLKIIEEN